MFESMLNGEMNQHLGCHSNDNGEKSTENRRNGYSKEILNTSAVQVDFEVDCDGSFEPQMIPKQKRCFGNRKQMGKWSYPELAFNHGPIING